MPIQRTAQAYSEPAYTHFHYFYSRFCMMIWNWNEYSEGVCKANEKTENEAKVMCLNNIHMWIWTRTISIHSMHAIVLWKYDGQSVIQYSRIACDVNVCMLRALCWLWYEMLNIRMNGWLMCVARGALRVMMTYDIA